MFSFWGCVVMMTVKNCYKGIGDYDRMSACFHTDEKISRFLGLFLKDDNYTKLEKALKEGNVEDAFIAAHTLKGVCQNLALDPLYEADVLVTEALRAKNLPLAKEHFPKVEKEFHKAFDRISQL